MTNYTEDEEDTEDENYEELVDQESDQLSSLNIKISEYEDYLDYLENLREQILKETEGISSASLGTGSFTLESKWERDASSVVIHEGEGEGEDDVDDDDEEPAYRISWNEGKKIKV
ncbi:uncharacterized protein LOC110745875 [Prunus avium]|uniref:Uncharacterized protein LOC110745875 n=1 Tax=Prunus avium TaxID=42229 RepID=A0A6P5R9X9_PRUAV|nr:uncharacterized protein LOC110745875 [Prunus avium]